MTTPAGGYDLSGLRVLLAEHNDLMRRAMVGILRTLNVPHVVGVGSEEDAWERFCDTDFDLVLCDWSPGLDGLSFLDRVRLGADTPNPFATVILVSAFAEKEHVTAARDHGTSGYIVKPVSPRTMYRRIVQTIERERPFVRTSHFFGPDRRTRKAEIPPERERRADGRHAA